MLTRGKLLTKMPLSGPAGSPPDGDLRKRRDCPCLGVEHDDAVMVLGSVNEADVKLVEQLKRLATAQATTGKASARSLTPLGGPKPDLSGLSSLTSCVWNGALSKLMKGKK
ncbi:MAG TPA: hypothetical protein DCR55_17790 [Lentisphaeria bacterium]|nr:hypothetical protein [Lentisphaeria bacterium]